MTIHQMFQETASTMFKILAHHRRRYVIHCLRKYENPMTLADLADEVAVLENDTALMEIPAEEIKRVYFSLYHTHIPKLADAELVQYQQDGDLVTLAERAENLDKYQEQSLIE